MTNLRFVSGFFVNKNYPVIITDQKCLKNGYKEWPSSYQDAEFSIKSCTYSSFLKELLKTSEFSKVSENSETLCNDVTNWTYPEFICSALSFQLLNIEIPAFGWSVITNILMNSLLSNDVLLFLKKLFL